MRKFLLMSTVFVFTCALSAVLGWIAGYDFDNRSWSVAAWVFFTLVYAFSLMGAVENADHKRKIENEVPHDIHNA